MGLDGVFGDEKLRGDLAIAEATGDQGENLELACRNAESLLASGIGSEGFEGADFRGGFSGHNHFPDHDRFAGGFATARDAEAEPDAKGCEEDSDERAVELDRVLDDDEAVFGVLEGGDEEAADETEDEDVALHDRGREEVYPRLPLTPLTPQGSTNKYSMKSADSDAKFLNSGRNEGTFKLSLFFLIL